MSDVNFEPDAVASDAVEADVVEVEPVVKEEPAFVEPYAGSPGSYNEMANRKPGWSVTHSEGSIDTSDPENPPVKNPQLVSEGGLDAGELRSGSA